MTSRIRTSFALLAAAALLTAAPALAQGVSPHAAAPDAPPGQSKMEGDALLAAAKAADLFDNITSADAPGIRLKHKASGVVCRFNTGDPENKVIVFDDGPRGDQIACETGGEAGQRVVYASRAAGRTLDDAFARDVAEMKKSHPDAQPYDLPDAVARSPILSMLNTPQLPRSKTARFIAGHQFTTVSSAMVGDWALEFRYSCPEERQDLAAATLQPVLWLTLLAQAANVPIDLAAPKQAV